MNVDINTILTTLIGGVAVGIYWKISAIGEALASHSATLIAHTATLLAHTQEDAVNFETIRKDVREVREEQRRQAS